MCREVGDQLVKDHQVVASQHESKFSEGGKKEQRHQAGEEDDYGEE